MDLNEDDETTARAVLDWLLSVVEIEILGRVEVVEGAGAGAGVEVPVGRVLEVIRSVGMDVVAEVEFADTRPDTRLAMVGRGSTNGNLAKQKLQRNTAKGKPPSLTFGVMHEHGANGMQPRP